MELFARMPYDLQRCIMDFTPHPAATLVSERFSKLRRECIDSYTAELVHFECYMGVARDRGDDYWYDIFENARDLAHSQYRAALEGLGGDPSEVVADP
jgi:hypothetical protein